MKRNFLSVLASALLFVSFARPLLSAPGAPDSPATSPIAVTLQIAPTSARRGAVVGFTLTARNTAKTTQTLRFNSGQSFEISATPEGKTGERGAWHWSHGKIFTQSMRSEKLAPGQAKTWTATWNQSDDRDAPLPRGKYVIQAWITANGVLKAAPTTLELTE